MVRSPRRRSVGDDQEALGRPRPDDTPFVRSLLRTTPSSPQGRLLCNASTTVTQPTDSIAAPPRRTEGLRSLIDTDPDFRSLAGGRRHEAARTASSRPALIVLDNDARHDVPGRAHAPAPSRDEVLSPPRPRNPGASPRHGAAAHIRRTTRRGDHGSFALRRHGAREDHHRHHAPSSPAPPAENALPRARSRTSHRSREGKQTLSTRSSVRPRGSRDLANALALVGASPLTARVH